MARQISRQDFEARFPERVPDKPTLRDAMGFMQDTVAFNGIYADLRRAGLTHEAATIAAQRAITGEVRSTNPLPENDNNRAIAGLPPQGAIPEEQRVAQLTPEQIQQYQALQQRLTQPRVQQVGGGSPAEAVLQSRILQMLASQEQTPQPTPPPVQLPRAVTPQEYEQMVLQLQSVTRRNGRFASPYKVTNPPSAEILAAEALPRVELRGDLPGVGGSPDQLPLNLSLPLPSASVEPAPAATTEKPVSRLAQLQDAVENAVNQSPEWAQSGLRLAGRWTLPALAGLAGFSALALLTGPEQRSSAPQEQQGAGPEIPATVS